MGKYVLLVVCIFTLCSCDYFKTQGGDAFQMISTPDGSVYRLDKRTGDTWLVQGKLMSKVNINSSQKQDEPQKENVQNVSPGTPFKVGKYTVVEVIPGKDQLNIGTFYKAEDGRFIKYLGKGSFGALANSVLIVGKTYTDEEGKSLIYQGKGRFEIVSSENAEGPFGKLVVNGPCYTETDEILIYAGNGKLKQRRPLKELIK
jgi:hypothetical protein